MVKKRSTKEQRAIWRRREAMRRSPRNRILTSQEASFRQSLAQGAPVHQAIEVAYPEVVTRKQAEKKLAELEKNPFVSEGIKISQQEYTKRLQKVIGEHPLDFIAAEEIDIVKSYRGAPTKHRSKAQPTLDSMKRSIGLDKADTGSKNLHLHLNVIKSEEEKKDLLRILGAQKIEDASFTTEGQSEQKD